MRVLLLICMPVLLAQAQYQEQVPFPESYDYYSPEPQETFPGSYQQQVQIEPAIFPEKSDPTYETEPTEPGPLDCREEQYPCTRLYSVHKPCKQCLNSLCFYRCECMPAGVACPGCTPPLWPLEMGATRLRRVYVINKEICMRTVCAHEELLRADLCRDQFSRCGVMASSGQCSSIGGSCGKSCGGC